MKPTSKAKHSHAMGVSAMTSLFVAAFFAGMSGCSPGPVTPESSPTIRGTIRGPGESGSLMIVAGVDSLSCELDRRAQVRFANAKIYRRSGVAAARDELQVGTEVSVWTTGIVLDVCPGIVSAIHAVIEDSKR